MKFLLSSTSCLLKLPIVGKARCKWIGRSNVEEIWRANDLLFCVHVVVKTLNLEIALQTTSKQKVRAARAARLFFLVQPILSLFFGVVVVVVVPLGS